MLILPPSGVWLPVVSDIAQSSFRRILRISNSLGPELDLSTLGRLRHLATRFDNATLQELAWHGLNGCNF